MTGPGKAVATGAQGDVRTDGAPGAGGPLSGVRIIDLTINVLGPVATQLLGDMGADVIKIEAPDGDPMRDTGPGRNPHMSAFYLNMNRNKKSVILDLKDPAARDVLWRMIDTADVVVHSMRPKAAARLGLTYAAVAERNPRVVFAFAPGYSPDGPNRDRPAFDDVIQGESGLAGMIYQATGKPGYLPTVAADKLCGVYLSSAIGMALFAREKTGRGQEVQVPMLETMLSFNLIEHLWTGAFGDEGSLGYGRALSPHRRPYATSDGFICLLAVNDAQWGRLFGVLGRPELADDPRFTGLLARTQNIDALYSIVAEEIAARTTSEWRERLDAADIPNGAMNLLQDLPTDPYLCETKFFNTYEHPSEGKVVTTSIPLRFSATPGSLRLPPPRLGEHSREVLSAMGCAPGEIEALAPSKQDERPT
jgi:crotonobetainyl-CoA:carnitine CoA-transferase CaiB-like acyl-CoA transferase